MSRIVLANNDSAYAYVPAQTKIDNLASVAMQLRVRIDDWRSYAGTYAKLVTFPGKGFALRYTRDTDGSPFSRLFTLSPSYNGSTYDFAAVMPANGNDIIVYCHLIAGGTVNLAIADSSGNVIIDSTHGTSETALDTSADSGLIWLFNSCFDNIAIWSAARTGAARFTKPESTDANLVALYRFAEGTGTTSADAVAGGAALVLNDATWTTGGTWNADTVTSSAAASQVAFSVSGTGLKTYSEVNWLVGDRRVFATVGASPSRYLINLDGPTLTNGQLLRRQLQVLSGDAAHERVTIVDCSSSGDVVLSPPLSVVPTAGDRVVIL